MIYYTGLYLYKKIYFGLDTETDEDIETVYDYFMKSDNKCEFLSTPFLWHKSIKRFLYSIIEDFDIKELNLNKIYIFLVDYETKEGFYYEIDASSADKKFINKSKLHKKIKWNFFQAQNRKKLEEIEARINASGGNF